MPWQAHPEFRDVEDDQRLWRYMPYAAYIEILRSRSLHFTRLDKLRDPYEGRFVEWDTLMALPDDARLRVRRRLAPERPQYAVNCWCARTDESVSLWERYAPHFGIGIVTTGRRFKASLTGVQGLVHLGLVRYSASPVPEKGDSLNVFRWLLHKLPAYGDEHEVRSVLWSMEGHSAGEHCWPDYFLKPWPEGGHSVPVDVDSLIEEVWVGPPWSLWFFEQVRDVSQKFGVLGSRVYRSRLMDQPY